MLLLHMKSSLLIWFLFLLSIQLDLQGQSTYDLVYDIFQAKCSDCHNSVDLRGGFDLEGIGTNERERMNYIYSKIVERIPGNEYAAGQGYKIIDPGRSDQSFLFRKINGDFEPSIQLHPDAGDPMPLRDGVVLSEIEKETIRQWILFGAPQSGLVADQEVISAFYNEGGAESFPDGPPPAPLPSEGFQIKIGPFFLEPIGEQEYFWKYETNLPVDTEVNRLDMDISIYSHHLIIYNFENEADQFVEPGFRLDQSHDDIGLVAGAQQSEDLKLPQGTAFMWKQDYVLDLNTHIINYTTDPLKAEGYINIYTQPTGTASQEMQALPVPNQEIYIPNDGEEVTAEQKLQLPFGNIWIWGMLGHTHQYGTGYKVWTLDNSGNKDKLIYNASCADGLPECASPFFDYQHIPTRFFDPLLNVNLVNGLIHEAKWINNGPRDVTWGPTSEDEMMILGVFFTLDTAGVSTQTAKVDPERPLAIYPNPFLNLTKVFLPDRSQSGVFRVFDSTGKQLYLQACPPDQVSIEWSATHVSKGLYIYQFQLANGQLYAGKLIKN